VVVAVAKTVLGHSEAELGGSKASLDCLAAELGVSAAAELGVSAVAELGDSSAVLGVSAAELDGLAA
jgi:hypothetical protein